MLQERVGALVLMGIGSFYLIDENLRATFVTMPIPILIASSLLVPWSGFVVAVMLIAAALLDIGSLSLLILLIMAIISYLFADSLERAYRESRYQALHDQSDTRCSVPACTPRLSSGSSSRKISGGRSIGAASRSTISPR